MDGESTGIDWSDLLTLDARARVEEVARRFGVLAGAIEDVRREALRDFVAFAYALPEVELQGMTEARLRGLLALSDPELRTIALSFDAVLDAMPAAIAMKRVALAQHAARALTVEERTRLAGLEPGIVAGASPSLVARGGGGHGQPLDPRGPWRSFRRG